jgi:hypothetical protein
VTGVAVREYVARQASDEVTDANLRGIDIVLGA